MRIVRCSQRIIRIARFHQGNGVYAWGPLIRARLRRLDIFAAERLPVATVKVPKPDRGALDAMIVEIELTLVSIIQGVALTMLIESAHEVLAGRELTYWPYVLGGLFIIFIFWSRAVLHIMTLIRWPHEFGHNFFYIGRSEEHTSE